MRYENLAATNRIAISAKLCRCRERKEKRGKRWGCCGEVRRSGVTETGLSIYLKMVMHNRLRMLSRAHCTRRHRNAFAKHYVVCVCDCNQVQYKPVTVTLYCRSANGDGDTFHNFFLNKHRFTFLCVVVIASETRNGVEMCGRLTITTKDTRYATLRSFWRNGNNNNKKENAWKIQTKNWHDDHVPFPLLRCCCCNETLIWKFCVAPRTETFVL